MLNMSYLVSCSFGDVFEFAMALGMFVSSIASQMFVFSTASRFLMSWPQGYSEESSR